VTRTSAGPAEQAFPASARLFRWRAAIRFHRIAGEPHLGLLQIATTVPPHVGRSAVLPVAAEGDGAHFSLVARMMWRHSRLVRTERLPQALFNAQDAGANRDAAEGQGCAVNAGVTCGYTSRTRLLFGGSGCGRCLGSFIRKHPGEAPPIGRYLDFCNGRRPHSSLDGTTPDDACFTPRPFRLAA
jgi:hypothetical protein